MVSTELTDRERQILEAVIRFYVESAEPAGSRSISRRFGLGVSPATIRNTMSDLEAKGFLFHPHTSAGRIPTDKAYRVYVDVRSTASNDANLPRKSPRVGRPSNRSCAALRNRLAFSPRNSASRLVRGWNRRSSRSSNSFA
jgi:hypothetical protein